LKNNWICWLICIDGKPLKEYDGTVTLYRIEDKEVEKALKYRFFDIACLTKDSSRVTLKKFILVPESFEDDLPFEDFMKKAQETKELY